MCGHCIHQGPAVVEKEPVPLAEVIQSRFPVWSGNEPVPGAFAVTHSTHLAFETIAWKGDLLCRPEGCLHRVVKYFNQVVKADVPDPVTGVHIMVAGVEISVPLDHGHASAPPFENAQGMVLPEGCPQCLLEDLHLDRADVPRFPFIKHPAKELAEFPCLDRTLAHLSHSSP